MHRTVARQTCWRVGVALRCRLPVDTLAELLHLVRMALLALCGNQLRRRSYFVWVAMTRKARYIDRAMHAGGRVGRLVRVTGGALHFDSFGWMRKVFDVGMTIGAPENPMNARRVFCRINCNISTRIGFHSRLAVASETAFILLQRLRGGRNCFAPRLGRRGLQNTP